MQWRTCRFCKDSVDEDDLLKYGVRHYAHPECFFAAGHKVDELHAWQVRNIPYRVLKKFDLLGAEQVQRCRQDIDDEIAEAASEP